jgi:hypothetical protein
MRSAAAIGALGVLLASTAFAADGVIEIGPSTSFPITTLANRSYVLTSNLHVADADTTAINLAAGSSLDLNGFSITGPAVCTGTPPACVGLGSGRGVLALGSGSTIRNGRIAGMGGDGIGGGAGTRVEKMMIEANGDDGIDGSVSSSAWSITDCRIVRNKDRGVTLNTGFASGVISRNSIWGNGTDGVYGTGLVVTDNAIYENGGFGISVFERIAPAHNALYGNNGGSTQPQTSGTLVETGPNACEDGGCP